MTIGGLLIFCNDYDYFIAHRQGIVSELPAKGVDVTAYCGSVPRSTTKSAFPIKGYHCDRHRFRPFGDLWLFFQMLILLARHRPKVVHTITLKPNLLGGLAVRLYNLLGPGRCRLVMMTAGLGRVFGPSQNTEKNGWTQRLVVLGLRFSLANGRGVAVFENTTDRDRWVSHGILPKSATRVVAGAGVDPAEFQPATPRHPLPPLRILFASRLLKSKGIELFINLAARMAHHGKLVEFIAAGRPDPGDPDSVDLAVRKLPPNVNYIGYCEDMPALLATTHVVLLPSVYAEGLPRILIEAAAAGNVVIASNIPGCRRIVIHGENGFLLPVHRGEVDFAATVRAVEALAADPELVEKMGNASVARFHGGGFDIASVRVEMETILFGENLRCG